MTADSRSASATEWHRRAISGRCGEIYQTSSIGETRATPSGDVSQSCGEGDKAKTEAMELLGNLLPPPKFGCSMKA